MPGSFSVPACFWKNSWPYQRVVLDLHGHALTLGSKLGPLGTAQLFIVPSSSSLKS